MTKKLLVHDEILKLHDLTNDYLITSGLDACIAWNRLMAYLGELKAE